jgi:hypothetical protein
LRRHLEPETAWEHMTEAERDAFRYWANDARRCGYIRAYLTAREQMAWEPAAIARWRKSLELSGVSPDTVAAHGEAFAKVLADLPATYLPRVFRGTRVPESRLRGDLAVGAAYGLAGPVSATLSADDAETLAVSALCRMDIGDDDPFSYVAAVLEVTGPRGVLVADTRRAFVAAAQTMAGLLVPEVLFPMGPRYRVVRHRWTYRDDVPIIYIVAAQTLNH